MGETWRRCMTSRWLEVTVGFDVIKFSVYMVER